VSERHRLIALREARGFTQASLAAEVGVERTTIGRWEAGGVVRPQYREPLATALDISLAELDGLLNGSATASPATGHGWWSNYETLEQAATSVVSWQPMLVPGLMQTRAYATALARIDDLVARRMSRQDIITRQRDPVSLTVVIDESVLHRPIGGADVLAGQLRHLLALNERTNVTTHVLPFTAQSQPAAWGSVVVLGFPWQGGLVYLEHSKGAAYLDSPYDVDNHHKVFENLRELALTADESLVLIDQRVKEISN
jgi:transcriptional regulator with XRE-family HTH domain